MKSYCRRLAPLIIALFFTLPTIAHAQLWPHIKTFGFDFGYPRETENLKFLATHHDAVIGAGEWQTKKFSEEQYDTLKAANPNVLIIPYVVMGTFIFESMYNIMQEWATTHNYDPEDFYLHYYYDNIVLTRTKVTKTSGTGLPSDWVCDKYGKLLADGETSNYFMALGYGGGSAQTREQARAYVYWNAGWNARMNHLFPAWKGAYKAWILDVMKSGPSKYADGIFIDTYQGLFDKDGYLPNMHQLIEVRDAGYGNDDAAARAWYAEKIALFIGELRDYLKAETGKTKIYIIPNFGEVGYTYNKYGFACADQFAPNKLHEGGIEYLNSPGSHYSQITDYLYKHYDKMASGYTFFNNIDTRWYDYGLVPPLGGKQWLIGSLYLFNHPNSFYGIHYGTASSYGPGIYPNIGEAKGGKFEDSHWDKMLEYDIGVPMIRAEQDFWGNSNSDRAYLIDHEAPGSWDPLLGREDPRGRWVLARDYTKAKVIVRYEKSFNNIDPKEMGTEPITYEIGGNFRRLLEDNTLGPVISKITLGLSEGAILIRDAEVTQLPAPTDVELKIIKN